MAYEVFDCTVPNAIAWRTHWRLAAQIACRWLSWRTGRFHDYDAA